MLSSLNIHAILIDFLWYLTSNLTTCDQKRCLKWFHFLKNLPRLDLLHRMWSILKKFPCALEKKVTSTDLGWNALYISVRSNWSTVSFKSCGSLLIFCFVDLSIGVSGVLKSPTIIVLLLFLLLFLLAFCFTYWSAPILGTYIFIIVISSSWIYFDYYVVPFFVSYHSLYFKIYFIWYDYWHSCFFFGL